MRNDGTVEVNGEARLQIGAKRFQTMGAVIYNDDFGNNIGNDSVTYP